VPMEMKAIRDLLVPIALDHGSNNGSNKPEPAIQAIAAALLQIAEGIDDLQRRLPTKADYF
jgi:hypothetical protein